MNKVTEENSRYTKLEALSSLELVTVINNEDASIASAVKNALHNIAVAVEMVAAKLAAGGKLFYIGAGTSGRLGVLDASEWAPTFGVKNMVIPVIAGGVDALQNAVEFAEDDETQGWADLSKAGITEQDIIIGISASGYTPYTVAALRDSRSHNISTISISCNPSSRLSEVADLAIEVVTGPEVITGSTRMKAGTAQKMVLNLISTCTMIRLGKIAGNRMIDMQLSNEKLIDRGIRMIMAELRTDAVSAREMLLTEGSVRQVLEKYRS